MTDYTKIIDYASKDILPTGDSNKIIKGAQVGAEFDSIETHSATKYDAADLGVVIGGIATDQTWSGSQRNAWVELTDGATVAVDFATSNNFYVTVGGNRTIGSPSNLVAGQSGMLVVEQDGTGTRVTTFHAAWDFGDTGNPTPNTTAAKKAVVTYVVDWDGLVICTFAGDF